MPGLYFEEFEPGAIIDHPTRRTVTETDNILFSTMTLNLAPLHLDAEYSKDSIYGQRLVNSLFILGLVSGISVPETTQGTTLGNLAMRTSSSPSPFFTVTPSVSAPRSSTSGNRRAATTPASFSSVIMASTSATRSCVSAAAPG